jgi:hypothetical protein
VAKIGVDIDGLLGSLAQFTSALAFAWPMAKGAGSQLVSLRQRTPFTTSGRSIPDVKQFAQVLGK